MTTRNSKNENRKAVSDQPQNPNNPSNSLRKKVGNAQSSNEKANNANIGKDMIQTAGQTPGKSTINSGVSNDAATKPKTGYRGRKRLSDDPFEDLNSGWEAQVGGGYRKTYASAKPAAENEDNDESFYSTDKDSEDPEDPFETFKRG